MKGMLFWDVHGLGLVSFMCFSHRLKHPHLKSYSFQELSRLSFLLLGPKGFLGKRDAALG